jgi:hypothetical protein
MSGQYLGPSAGTFGPYGSLTLGPIRFSGLAKPQAIPIGGRQEIAVHKLPGGARVLDVMGPDNAEICWTGYLDESNSSAIAQAIDALRQSAQVLTLAWDIFSYQVIISEFLCSITHIPMPYRITCTVLTSNDQLTISAPVSLLLQVNADLSSVAQGRTLSNYSENIIGNSISLAATAVAAPNATTAGSANYSAALNAANYASSTIASAFFASNVLLAPLCPRLSSLSTANSGVDVVEMSAQIIEALSYLGDLAQLSFMSAYVTRAASTLQQASA